MRAQQRRFNSFRKIYNEERPHMILCTAGEERDRSKPRYFRFTATV